MATKIIHLKIRKTQETGKRNVYLDCTYWDHAVPKAKIRTFLCKQDMWKIIIKVLAGTEEQKGHKSQISWYICVQVINVTVSSKISQTLKVL